MKRQRTLAPIAAAVGLFLGAGAAAAADDRFGTRKQDQDDERSRVTYSGIGLSRLSTGFDNVKDAVSLDAVLGFRVPDVQWFGIELGLGFTIIPGEVETSSGGGGGNCGGVLQPPCPGETISRDDFQAFNLGVFAVLRSPGRLYGMGKLGYRYVNTNLPELDDDRSGNAWGAGVGYRYSKSGGFAELAYTQLTDDLELLGFALGYGFGGRK